MWVDYHIHTTHSVDGYASPSVMCRQAIAVGLREVAITDHLDSNPSDEGAGRFDPERYFRDLDPLRTELADHLSLCVGVEVGEPHEYPSIVEGLGAWPFDVIIGSVHYVGHRGVHASLFDDLPLDRALSAYFDLALQIASCRRVDVLGHLDYFQRYTCRRNMPPFDPCRWEGPIRAVLEAAIKNDVALEVNTSGVRQAPGVCFPGQTILTWYHQMGGRAVTIGSDAHYVEHVGANLSDAVRLLTEVGFNSLCVFKGRRRSTLPLPRVDH